MLVLKMQCVFCIVMTKSLIFNFTYTFGYILSHFNTDHVDVFLLLYSFKQNIIENYCLKVWV